MDTSRSRRPARPRGRTTSRLAVAGSWPPRPPPFGPDRPGRRKCGEGDRLPGAWQLTVDGAPYTVKGLTWGPSVADAGRYMPDVKSMGVNTIRTWGTDATTKPVLDSAAENGIKVIAGFWLQPGGGPGSGGCVNYLTDTAYKNDMLAEFPKWVEAYKDHEGVLMWNVGNESVLGLQNCYSGDELERQRDAYTTFVNEVAKKIHAVDPNRGHLHRRLDRCLAVLQEERTRPRPVRRQLLRRRLRHPRHLGERRLRQALHRHRGRARRRVGGPGRRQRHPGRTHGRGEGGGLPAGLGLRQRASGGVARGHVVPLRHRVRLRRRLVQPASGGPEAALVLRGEGGVRSGHLRRQHPAGHQRHDRRRRLRRRGGQAVHVQGVRLRPGRRRAHPPGAGQLQVHRRQQPVDGRRLHRPR